MDFEWEADAYGGNLPSPGCLGAPRRFVSSTPGGVQLLRICFYKACLDINDPACDASFIQKWCLCEIFVILFGLFTPALALRVTAPFFSSPVTPSVRAGPGG